MTDRDASSARLRGYAQMAADLARGYMTGDGDVIRRLNRQHGSAFPWDHDPALMHRRLPTWYASPDRSEALALADARRRVAAGFGFDSWDALEASVTYPGPPVIDALGWSRSPPFFRLDRFDGTLFARSPALEDDWDVLIGVMREEGVSGFRGSGPMSKRVTRRLAAVPTLTRLDLGGALLDDDAVRPLAAMGQLEELSLGGSVSDRGLEILRQLPLLRRFHMGWAQGISDVGAANLRHCRRLESVNLMGTRTGDGAVAALAGHQALCDLKTGAVLTDAGLRLVHDLPVFTTWQGGELRYGLMGAGAGPNHLMIDGPITNAGLASLEGLDGLFGLSVFWHAPAVDASGLGALGRLPHLGFLGWGGERCDDESMHRIGQLPGLRMLMAQGTVATDAGFSALSRCITLEYLWGRECPNLTGTGFAALASMPALRGLAVSCARVGDDALALLPEFPALRELMPMDVTDDGFRHVGACTRLEALWCMYCRDIGDVATSHLTALEALTTYYAGSTRITDRSLELLGRMPSLERIQLADCPGVTSAGIAALAGLPRLREITLDGLPGVSRAGAAVFPDAVRVRYEP